MKKHGKLTVSNKSPYVPNAPKVAAKSQPSIPQLGTESESGTGSGTEGSSNSEVVAEWVDTGRAEVRAVTRVCRSISTWAIWDRDQGLCTAAGQTTGEMTEGLDHPDTALPVVITTLIEVDRRRLALRAEEAIRAGAGAIIIVTHLQVI